MKQKIAIGHWAIFCFIHFLLYVFRLLCLRFFNCRKDQSFRIFFYFKCFTDPGLLKIRQLSTSCHCGPFSLQIKKITYTILHTVPLLTWKRPRVKQAKTMKHKYIIASSLPANYKQKRSYPDKTVINSPA